MSARDLPPSCRIKPAVINHTDLEEKGGGGESRQKAGQFETHELIEADDLVVLVYFDNMVHDPSLVKYLSSAFQWDIIQPEGQENGG